MAENIPEELIDSSFALTIAGHFTKWRRIARIFLSGLITLFFSMVIGLPILYIQSSQTDFLGGETPPTAPVFIMGIVAFFAYVIAWSSLVGFKEEDRHDWQPSALSGWVVITGLVSLLVFIIEVAVWIAYGL